jgi:hypothetical protein
MNRKAVNSAAEFTRVVNEVGKEKRVLLLVRADGI